MATAAGLNLSPSLGHYPDQTSPVYPDRPIRPLPKRTLRSRLSPDQVNSIVYPPAPVSAASHSDSSDQQPTHSHIPIAKANNRNPSGADIEHDESNQTGLQKLSPSNCPDRRSNNNVMHTFSGIPDSANNDARFAQTFGSNAPQSTTSSVDSYDPFENTNNNKKRKVPLSMGPGSLALTEELASMGISQSGEETASNSTATGSSVLSSAAASLTSSSSPGTGISGAGRGRFGRSGRGSNERRPLSTLPAGLNTAVSTEPDSSYRASPKDQGIISAAIANAAQQGPIVPQKGKENVSLLAQETSKPTPQKAQFTFTCESDSSKTMAVSHQMATAQARAQPTPLSQQGRVAARQAATNNAVHQYDPAAPQAVQGTQQHQPQQPAKPRRPLRPAKVFAAAARRRREDQQYYNLRAPPRREDVAICSFCMYEAIFGRPPEALIRQYEIKDRKARKEAAEKRRLLEKAKMKNRKGKKGGKGNKNSGAAQQPANKTPAQQYDPPGDEGSYHSPDYQGDDYYDDEFDDVPIASGQPTPNVNVPTNGAYFGEDLANTGALADPGSIGTSRAPGKTTRTKKA